jgi:hypothetical protein
MYFILPFSEETSYFFTIIYLSPTVNPTYQKKNKKNQLIINY